MCPPIFSRGFSDIFSVIFIVNTDICICYIKAEDQRILFNIVAAWSFLYLTGSEGLSNHLVPSRKKKNLPKSKN